MENITTWQQQAHWLFWESHTEQKYHFGSTNTTFNRVTPSNSISSLSCHAETASHPPSPVVPCDNGSEKKQLISSQYSWQLILVWLFSVKYSKG